jgi:hypothetical protein
VTVTIVTTLTVNDPPCRANRSRLPSSRLGTIDRVGTIKSSAGADKNRFRVESFPGVKWERLFQRFPLQINDLQIIPSSR